MYSFIHLAALLTGLYALYFITSAIYLVFFHPLSKYPGPKLWAASRIPWALHVIRGDLWQTLEKLHDTYGPVVRIAPDELTTIEPSAWKDLYMSKPLLLKDPYSQTPPLNGAHSLFTAEGDTHRRIRAVLVNSFSDKALRSQAPIIEKYANQLIARIQREANHSDDGAVDLTKLYGYATFDTITDLSLGETLVKGLEAANEHGWVKNYFFHAKFSAIRTALSRFSPLNTMLGLFLLGITSKARQRNWGVITGALDRRLARNDAGEMSIKRSDLLTALEDRLDESATKGITKAEMTSNALAFVLAGTQLNTNVLSTATYLLLRERSAWEHLVKELRTRFSSDDEITVHSTQNLPYLEAVINETVRIRHPTPINLPRVISGAGYVLNDEVLPRNVVIGVNLQNIQNASSLWLEPRKFHPERFLPPTDPRYDTRFDRDVKEAFAPFSVGPRNCIGSKLFYTQVRLVLAKVVWNYDLIPMQSSLQEDWLMQRAWFAFEPQPLLAEPLSAPPNGTR